MTISKLSQDLLVEILIRGLPNPRSACRCKLVCKLWSSLISSPRFNRDFVSYHQTMNRLNHPPMPDDPYELQSTIRSFLPPLPKEVSDALTVLDCNKDLVLCGFSDLHPYGVRERSRSYLVCNPFTKQWIALPLAPKSTRYMTEARLVCKPRISNKLDLGDGQAFVYSEYRFRVACLYQHTLGLRLDVFCSESGEWTQGALVCDDDYRASSKDFISCNGELFWMYTDRYGESAFRAVARFSPFRLDMPPTCIIDPPVAFPPGWAISSSQGALHVIALENKNRYSIWRLEEDGKSWKKQCEGLVNKTSAECCDYNADYCYHLYLHPHDPEIVFFNSIAGDNNNKYVICCWDLRREESEFFAELGCQSDLNRLQVFQPRFSCWPTPIPKYEELRGVYDGTDSFWVQGSSSEAKTPHIPQSLIICMDRVMKSTSYKDYIEHVTAEATVAVVAQIIKQRQKEIGGNRRQHPSPALSNELDVMKADLADVEADMAILGEQKAELQHALVRETAELPHLPPGSRREPSRWGVKHIMGLVMRGLHLLQRNSEGKE